VGSSSIEMVAAGASPDRARASLSLVSDHSGLVVPKCVNSCVWWMSSCEFFMIFSLQ